jgi:hypothetical protein
MARISTEQASNAQQELELEDLQRLGQPILVQPAAEEPEPEEEEAAEPEEEADEEPQPEEADDEPELPAQSASKADWVAYAVELGYSEDECNAMTKQQLIEALTS